MPINEDGSVRTNQFMIQLDQSRGNIPVEPAIGQIWNVAGKATSERRPDKSDQIIINWKIIKSEDTETLEFERPNDGESFAQFISADPTFKGIGEGKARALWTKFGEDIFKRLDRGNADDIKELGTILSTKAIKSLFAGYERYKHLSECVWMTKAGIDHATQRRILRFNHGTVETIKADPYELVHFGVGLKKIDEIVTKHDWPERDYSAGRVKAVAHEALQKGLKNGHTYTHKDFIKQEAARLGGDRNYGNKVLEFIANNRTVAVCHATDGSVHPSATAIQELAVAKRFKAMTEVVTPFTEQAQESLDNFINGLGYTLTEKQIEAVKTCVSNQISCITGGAGTGKTTVLNAVLAVLNELGYSVSAVALSGRAAMRLHESIGFVTSTIARFLREDPLECREDEKKLLVIDESSMIDLPTMYKLIRHISPNVRLILAGDPSQLPPIGIGKILKDVVDSGLVANTMLDVVKRQEGSSGIPEYSNTVNAGEVPEKLATGAIEFISVDAQLAGEALEQELIDIAVKLYELDPESARVIAPTRSLVASSNLAIQAALNPNGQRLEWWDGSDKLFLDIRVGDRVLFTRNHIQEGVQNGTLGVLVNAFQTRDSFGSVLLDNGETIELTAGLLDSIELGYAITLHKAQGSQFPKPIVLMKDGAIMDRAWVYTAITRAEEGVILVGQESAFRKAVIAEATSFKRKTMLKSLLRALSVNEFGYFDDNATTTPAYQPKRGI